MRKLAANYIFPASRPPLKNGIIVLDDNNTIVELIDTQGDLREIASLEFFNGVITPAFVNTHCHLELSHLKGKIPQHTGLQGFVGNIIRFRKQENRDEVLRAMQNANDSMLSNGIGAVGDISNQEISFQLKSKSQIYYHTFIEIFSLYSYMADSKMDTAYELSEFLKKLNLPYSIVPHANYTVSKELFRLISDNALKNNSILSLHNQETESENDFYRYKKGTLYETFEKFGIDMSEFHSTGKNSLSSVLDYLNPDLKLCLIHNTYTTESDFDEASERMKNLFWVLCPNSNLYIENQLPDIELFIRKNAKVALGTDSLASNTKLSILEEMKTIQKNSSISFETLIQWATLNGAEALAMNKNLGSLEVGKVGRLNLIQNFDFQNMKLTDKSTVKSL